MDTMERFRLGRAVFSEERKASFLRRRRRKGRTEV